MNIRICLLTILLLFFAWPAAAKDNDFLAIMAQQSEIKAIAKITKVIRMQANSDGTVKQATFKRIYAVTPDTQKTFFGQCKTYESAWQKRVKGLIYFNPKPGQVVYVTVTTDDGAITSFTPLTPELEHIIRSEPGRIRYAHGKAKIAYPKW